MAVAQKGAITFGLVYIPVDLYAAVQDNNIRFNQLDRDSHRRVRYKKVVEGEDRELAQKDIIKGYEYEKGKYVVVTDEEMEAIKTEKDRSIQILQFTDQCSIPPIYYDRPYYVVGQKGGEKAYEVLCRAMKESGKVAIGKTVMGQSETMLTLIPSDHGLLLVTMFYYDEVREVPRETARPAIGKPEMDMALKLIQSMDQPYEPEKYQDEFQQRLRDLIARKIEGQEVAAPKKSREGHITDLMEALSASLEQQTGAKKTRARKKAG